MNRKLKFMSQHPWARRNATEEVWIGLFIESSQSGAMLTQHGRNMALPRSTPLRHNIARALTDQ
jgi:hypothetical protein